MSVCQCISCNDMVPGYQKYCYKCVKRYGVWQDLNFWRAPRLYDNWETYRANEFKKDLSVFLTIHASKDIQPETIDALQEAMVSAVEYVTGKKKRKRAHKNV